MLLIFPICADGCSGAYLSTAYALRYPKHVSRLILLSPCGVRRNQDAIDAAEESTDSNSINGSFSTASVAQSSLAGSTTREAVKSKRAALKAAANENKEKQSRFLRFFFWAWNEGWTPFQVVRSTLFLGPLLVGKYSSRRFPTLSEDDVRDMHDYLWHITSDKGSGEYCICE